MQLLRLVIAVDLNAPQRTALVNVWQSLGTSMKEIAFKFNSMTSKNPISPFQSLAAGCDKRNPPVCQFNPNNPVNCGTEGFYLSCDNDGFVTRLCVRLAFHSFFFFFSCANNKNFPELWLRTNC